MYCIQVRYWNCFRSHCMLTHVFNNSTIILPAFHEMDSIVTNWFDIPSPRSLHQTTIFLPKTIMKSQIITPVILISHQRLWWLSTCLSNTKRVFCFHLCPANSSKGTLHYCYDSPLFFSFGLVFSFLTITHPPHDFGLLTTLVFIIASFHPLLWTSMTHLCLLTVLLHDSIAFYHVPIALSLFQTFPSLRYINPQLATYFPKLDLLCTLVHCHTNLVPLLSPRPLTLWEPLLVLWTGDLSSKP